MTDNTIDTRLTLDETREIRRRFSRFSSNKFKATEKYVRKQTRSSSLSASLCYGKDVRTPKHYLRRRFNCCTNGDSPSEAEALQDIIWDPASPSSIKNGKAAEESLRVMEISEIVKRIAPNKEKPVDKDSVLQWIGETAIPCTPEIQKPRVPRNSARQQNNNVEDLLILAKQFDLNMTRQHKERNLERLQNNKGVNCKDLHRLNKLTATHPESENSGALTGEAKKRSHEEELHALFDEPTQHLSVRLSPSSTNCSQESKFEKTATHGMRPDTSDKNLLEDAHVSKPDFDDDWENDDLLSDFVLAVTQDPQFLTSFTAESSSQIGSAAAKKCEPTTEFSSSALISRAGCSKTHQITRYYTRMSSKTCTNPITFQLADPIQCNTVMQLPKTSRDSANTVSEYPTTHTLCGKQQIVMTTVCPGAKDLATSAVPSGKELDPLWGDGDDDDLLYQACDDLEQISVSKEQQRQNNSSKFLYSSSEISSSIITTISSSLSRNSRIVQPEHVTEHSRSVCVLARSHSIPGASGIHRNKQNVYESASTLQVNHYPKNSRQQDRFTQLRHTTGPSSENSHYSKFKRHQSDPGVLRNKVLITAQPTMKCSAAEIERKKQEAIARRKLRLQATQKTSAPS